MLTTTSHPLPRLAAAPSDRGPGVVGSPCARPNPSPSVTWRGDEGRKRYGIGREGAGTLQAPQLIFSSEVTVTSSPSPPGAPASPSSSTAAKRTSIVVKFRKTNKIPGSHIGPIRKPGRGWHGRTVELESALGGGNGSYRAPDPLLPPMAGSSGCSGEVAWVKAVFPTVRMDYSLLPSSYTAWGP